MSLAFIIILVLLALMVVAAPRWPYSRGWGLYPSGGIGVIVIILVVLVLAGRV